MVMVLMFFVFFRIFTRVDTVELVIGDNKDAEESSSINLICAVVSLYSAVTLFNPCSTKEGTCSAPLGGSLGACDNPNMIQSLATVTTTLTIPSFSINSHHGCWRCTHGSDEKTLCVQGYIIPLSLTSTVLSSYSRTFMINTDCAFPKAKMKWQLVDAPDLSGKVVYELGHHDCIPIDNGTCATFTGCTTVAQNASEYSCSYTVPNGLPAVKGDYYVRGSVVLSGQYGSLVTSSNYTFTTLISFDVTVAPRNICLSPSGQQIVTEGLNLQPIICSARCNPVCSYSWSRQGDSTTTQGAVLRLDGITRDQGGVYICTASNKYGTMTTDVAVAVNYEPGDSITLNPRDENYIRNEDDVLPNITCEANCKPSCGYVWMLPSNNNITGPFLSLSTLKRDEQGTYTCVAGNEIGESLKNVSVIVQYPSDNTATTNVSSVSISEGDRVYILCEVKGGNPKAQITWSCFGGTTTDVGTDTDSRSVIAVLGSRNQDGHHCICRGQHNLVTITPAQITFNVEYGPGESVTLSPSVVAYTRNENDVLPIIHCIANCRPNCSYVWMLPSNTNTTGPVLSLSVLKRDEQGTYRCVARNIYGESLKTVVVNVYYGPGTSITFNSTSPVTQMENTTLAPVNCTADCRPSCTVTWTDKGGKTMTNPLTLGELKRDEAGNYTCTAANVVHSNTKIFTVHVQDKTAIDPHTICTRDMVLTQDGYYKPY